MKRERWIALIILFLSLLIGVSLFCRIFSPLATPSLFDNTTENKDIGTSETSLMPLANAVDQLFANPKLRDETDTETSEKAPWESHLYRLVLKGTAGTALAVLQDMDGGPEIVVRPGDTIGHARVARIERNLLELDGVSGRDILQLPAGDHGSAQPASRNAKTPSRFGGMDGELLVIEREKLRDLTTRVDALSGDISLQPVRNADGEPAGFRIAYLNPDGLFTQMGLFVGDIVTSVNGQTILTMEDAYRVLGSAPHQNTLSLSILRERQPMEIDYVIR
ncbi:MAG: PDZ domain-containing protein [bacterium]